jgi:hypothetical protein
VQREKIGHPRFHVHFTPTWTAVFFLATGAGAELSLRALVPGTEHAMAVRSRSRCAR